ncbi:hypothetical protein [Psychrilyobacter atlanticus]|uniref:hypothetical protein n=1 Tax=Psychrilyobacter atlanticus TaxID=271091 RepID=UPI00048B2E39|nr:hypothetical protein [Psychrilyobacter atlanticus]
MLYCIDLKTNQVHILGCRHIPKKNVDKNFLGRFDNPNDAITDAGLKGYTNVNSCSDCCSSST